MRDRLDPGGAIPHSSVGLARVVRWIGASAEWCRALSGWRRAVAAMLAGAVSVLAMPPFFLWPLLFLTVPVVIWLLEGAVRPPPEHAGATRRRRLARSAMFRTAAVGWCFAFGFHVPGLYWLREAFAVTAGNIELLWPLAVIGLPAYLALYAAAATAAAARFEGPSFRRLLALAAFLACSEWLRGHAFTGFPWNTLGYALTWPLSLMQSASVLGIYGLTAVTVVVLGAPGVVLAESAGRSDGSASRVRPWLAIAAVSVAPLAVMAAFGMWRLSFTPPPMVAGVKLRLVQPSIPQRDKWSSEKQAAIFQRHLELSRRDPSGRVDDLKGITHLVWPEAAMPFQPLLHPEALAALDDLLPPGTQLLAGMLRSERASASPGDDDIRAYNSLGFFDDRARPTAIYDKIHLVPYGEYLPFHATLEAIGLKALTRQRGGFTPGASPRRPLSVAGLPPADVLICYEAVFPAAVVQGSERPGVVINITNDGWFGNSTGPRQHNHQARVRAVEEGIPLLRVANNGISAVYDAYGRELARLDLDEAGVIDTGLPRALPPTVYGRLGDTLLLLVVLGLAAWLYAGRAIGRAA